MVWPQGSRRTDSTGIRGRLGVELGSACFFWMGQVWGGGQYADDLQTEEGTGSPGGVNSMVLSCRRLLLANDLS